MAEAASPRKRRRLRRLLAFLVITPLITLAGLPTFLSTSPARLLLVGLANRYLAPARIDVAQVRLAWFGSLSVSGLKVRDPKGKQVLAISRVLLDRSLLELLIDRSGPGSLTLVEPALDVTRRADGSIDLVELLPRRAPVAPRPRKPSAPPPPVDGPFDVDFTLKVVQGSLRVQAPELIEPLTVDRIDLNVQTTAAPGPLNLRLRMEKGSGAAGSSLAIDGIYDLRAPSIDAADLTLNVLARRWPFTARFAAAAARGTFDGQLAVIQKGGRWDLKGDTRLYNLEVSGGALAGDRLRLDLVTAIWDVVQGIGSGERTWDVRRLKLVSPVGTLAATGPILGPPGTAATVEGRLELTALARQLPHALRLRDGLTFERGEAGLRFNVRYEPDAEHVELGAQLADVIAHDDARTISLRRPANLAVRLVRRGSNLSVEQLDIASDFVRTSGSGDLDQGIKVSGDVDLGALEAQLRDLVEFGGLELAGQGEYTLNYRRTGTSFTGGLRSEFHGLNVKGATAEPIQREAVRLEAAFSGGVNPSGLPRTLGDLKVGLSAGQIGVATAATSNNATAISLVATGPLTLSEKTDGVARGELKLQAAWHAPTLDISELRLGVQLPGTPPEAGPLDLAVQGHFDSQRGELALSPVAGTAPRALGLTANGLLVKGFGPGRPPTGRMLEANVLGDLASLDQLIAAVGGSGRMDLAGSWAAQITAHPAPDGRLELAASINSPDLSRGGAAGQPRSQDGPIALAGRAAYKAAGGVLDFQELKLVTRYAALDAKGPLADATGRRLADLQGVLTPNWQNLNALMASAVEPRARVQGGAARPFRIRGPLSGSSLAELLKGLDVEVGVDLAGAHAYGLTFGPAPLVVLCDRGRTIVAPIMTSLNNGRIDLRPELVLDDPRGLTLRLLPGSGLENVEINDDVSHEVLSFIAPILEEATHVHGRISASFVRADFPIGGDADRTMTVTGNIVFNDVLFGAGPLGSELLSLAGKGPDTALRINQPIQLSIFNRRIHQSGLVIPLSNETRITVKGSVGFDQTLALRAEVPVNPSVLGRDPTLQKLAAGTTIPVPVGGTMSHPKVDRHALSAAMREVTRSLLKRGAQDEASDLLKRFVR